MRTRLVMAGLVLLLTPADPARSQAIQPVCPSPHDRTVAITFDDLPYTRAGDAGGQELAAVARATNEAILAGLAVRNVPAIGFVVERRVQALGEIGQALLEPWNTGQFELGNHSANHPDSNTLDVDAFRREVIDGEASIRPMVEKAGRTLRFFRFPYNHLGDTDQRREAFERVLGERGYHLAASTIDYVFDAAYERALARSDTAMVRRIEDAYIDYSRVEIAYDADLNRKVLGCEPPGILLLHDNRINAATIDRILGLFRSTGYRFVSLEEAQAHPAYRKPPRHQVRTNVGVPLGKGAGPQGGWKQGGRASGVGDPILRSRRAALIRIRGQDRAPAIAWPRRLNPVLRRNVLATRGPKTPEQSIRYLKEYVPCVRRSSVRFSR
ncbi:MULTISPECIES: polysaccharide deacetylase family protein [unclassified Ensifer]|uniref:polysaccharide deacetylase family protein n=1 Tax=unclassified Ensifer TaxID=2633371 RepID=UPI00071245A7|nr:MULTISPECIES: polysaccharide deacetylase family protein [unclassified Ensifer]KQX48159.1 hypothetical protein ASD49_33640 [Ensifer sp. Root1298]KQX73524.1 hypothetical protein ASD41_11160 [Ensifer sp. Root1312]KRC17951.1 hypothetical protein ASE29_33485 [Ensifer sp. Root74]KRD72798.1 hypothetical protein ASE71_20985 [Ensifer sp. Root954]